MSGFKSFTDDWFETFIGFISFSNTRLEEVLTFKHAMRVQLKAYQIGVDVPMLEPW